MTSLLPNRAKAGELLALKLAAYSNLSDTLVLCLPRGGVPVAFVIATNLNLPLDIFLVRKLGVPKRQELAMGAIAIGGIQVINQEIVESLNISPEVIQAVAAKEQEELLRRDRLYRGDRPLPEINNRTIILVDDGIATGSTLMAAIVAIKQQKPTNIIVATPVATASMCEQLATEEVDKVVCIVKPPNLHSISLWYEDFTQTTDEEVCNLLATARSR